MTQVLEENLRYFFKRYPAEKARLASAIPSLAAKIEETLSGLRLFEGSQLVDSTEPHFFPQLEQGPHPARILFINGFGIGALLQNTLTHPLPETEEYIVVEPSAERFFFALNQTFFGEIFENPKIHWFVGMDASELNRQFFVLLSDRERLEKAKASSFRTHAVIEALHPGYFQNLKRLWEMAVEVGKNGHGFLADSLEGLKNTIGNKKWIEENPGVDRLKNRFSDLPAIIVSTGPSLKKTLPELKELQSKSLLLAADASLKILIQNGIHPHFVFCLERDEGSKPFFVEIPREQARAHLIVFPLVPQTVIGAYSGPHWVVYRQYGYYRFFEDQAPRGVLRSGPSVSHMALAFAEHLGCKKATLVGQDLAYDPDTFASHPEGISYEEWSHQTSEEALRKKLEAAGDSLIWVPGNLRERVPTSGFYEIFRMNFGEAQTRHRLEISNSTQGGAKIPGLPWKPLSEFSRDFKAHSDLFERIEEIRKSFKPSNRIDLNIMKSAIDLMQKKIDGLFSNASRLSTEELRHRQRSLQSEPMFMALTGNFSGKRLIELEWKWNLLFDSDPARSKVLTEWKTETTDVLRTIRGQFT